MTGPPSGPQFGPPSGPQFGPPSAEPLDELFRRETGQVLATLIRVLGDFDLAEDALKRR
jgi:hypothetical protein